MELVVDGENLRAAYKRVKRNKGSPGIDGMRVEDLRAYLWTHWEELREQLLSGRYQPQPVMRHEVPKPKGGTRALGIPTVVDRFIQQALLQVLQPMFVAGFSAHSYGFIPGRSAHDAVRAAHEYVEEGREVVVDVDLSKFFDRVHHDLLMGRVAQKVRDRRVLRLIRRYLEAGVMSDGVVQKRFQGTPQGGPLSPLLANVLLDEVDHELERQGHAFARYADDLNVYVRSRRAGERVMARLRRLFHRLHLVVNEDKSAVASVFARQFLGFAFWRHRGTVKRRVAPHALRAMKERVRALTGRARGRSMDDVMQQMRSYLLGWRGYFRLAETPLIFRELDKWIRHRLRALQLKQWKNGATIRRELLKLGASASAAQWATASVGRWWAGSCAFVHMVLQTRYFDEKGIPRLVS